MILKSIAKLVNEAYGLNDVKFALVVVEEKENIERLIYKGNIGAESLVRIIKDHLNYIKYETPRPATDTSAQ